MNDISKQYKITLNTKGVNTLSSDQLLFNHGDDVTIKISIVEDNVNKDISQSKVDLLVLYESDSDPTIHRFEDGGISINDNEVTVVCKNSYVDRIGVSVCQLIIRDEDQSITTQMFSYKTGSTLVSNDMDQAVDKINTLIELDKTIEKCVSKIKEANDLITKVNDTVTEVSTKVVELETKVEDEILGVDSVLRDVERAESERVDTFNQIKMDNEALKSSVEDAVSNIRDGVTPDITVGDVSTLQPGASVSIVRRGSKENPIFDFSIPQGAPGRDGVDGITPDMTEFEKKINEQYEDIINKNNTFKKEMNTDFGNAKTGYDGKEYLNVVDRLNGDFDNVHQRINDSSYLEYSGSNIKADNSYYGLTKELSIKGRTLQNLCPSGYTIDWQHTGTWLSTFLYDNSVKVSNRTLVEIKPNTKYTIVINITQNTSNMDVFLNNFDKPNSIIHEHLIIPKGTTGLLKYVVTTIEDFSTLERKIFLRAQSCGATEGVTRVSNIIILEGDYTNTPLEELPFGEGIYSVGESEDNLIKVKSCGKNLIDRNKITKGYINSENGEVIDALNNVVTPYMKIKPNTNYIGYSEGSASIHNYSWYDINKNFIKRDSRANYVTSPSNAYYLRYHNQYVTSGETIDLNDVKIQVSEGTSITSYEPYQESTQELQLTEPLRSLPNGACDEILVNGDEIRRVVRYVLNGSENWRNGVQTNESFIDVRLALNQLVGKNNRNGLCDTLPYASYIDAWIGIKEGISVYNHTTQTEIIASIPKTKVIDLQSWKDWLSQNPTTVYYELNEPIIKKHNKNINLKTFEGITHITSDNYLLPTITCKVPSNVQAVVMSLKEENEFLNNAVSLMSLENEEVKLVNEAQDELINTTMLATDEMYMMLEPLLSEVAQTLSLEREVSKMVDLYVAMVMRGLKTIEQVPARYREQVKEILAQLEK